jgi:hypothetical protein
MNKDMIDSAPEMIVRSFIKQYSDLFDQSTLGGIMKVAFESNPIPILIVEIGEKQWISNLIPNDYQGIKIIKTFV